MVARRRPSQENRPVRAEGGPDGEAIRAERQRLSQLVAIGETTALLAHELNQPLAALMNYLHVARRALPAGGDAGAERLAGLLARAIEQIDRAGTLVGLLRRVARSAVEAHLPGDVNRVVRESADLAFANGAANGVATSLALAEALPAVAMDAPQIRHVVCALLRNAVDAVAGAERRAIEVRTAAMAGSQVEIRVEDSGTGVSPAIADRLFLPFVTTKPDGVGLDLAVSRSIVAAHGGRIWTVPGSGGGAAFHILLPAASDDGGGDRR